MNMPRPMTKKNFMGTNNKITIVIIITQHQQQQLRRHPVNDLLADKCLQGLT